MSRRSPSMLHRGYLRAQKRVAVLFPRGTSSEITLKHHDLRFLLATAFRDGAIWMQRSARKSRRS